MTNTECVQLGEEQQIHFYIFNDMAGMCLVAFLSGRFQAAGGSRL